MVVRMRHTRAHTGNRRSHHALSAPRLSACKDCGALHVRHTACAACGRYRGKVVLDVAKAATKRTARAAKRRGGAGEPGKEPAQETPSA